MSLTFANERVSRSSFQQKEAMLQFMEQHPEIGNEKISSQYGIHHKREKWAELTKILNRLPGKPKNPGKWQKAWQDWRYNTRKKTTGKNKIKLTHLEEKLLNISNFDIMQDPVDTWTANSIEQVQIKSEIIEDNINEILETNFIDLNNESKCNFDNLQISNVSTLATNFLPEPALPSIQFEKPRRKRKYINCDRNNAKEIWRMAKCVENSANSVKRICKTQAETSSKIVSLLEENSRTLQSLAESQMRQAEALERQVSLEESRNSILKHIALTLNSLKKI